MAETYRFLHPSQHAHERKVWSCVVPLVDERGSPLVPISQINTVMLTLYDPEHAGLNVINSINQVNIHGTGRGALDASANLRITLTGNDLIIVDHDVDKEKRRGIVEYTHASGAKPNSLVFEFVIRNLYKLV